MQFWKKAAVLLGALPLLNALPVSQLQTNELIPGEYVVTFKKGVTKEAIEAHTSSFVSTLVGRIDRRFDIHTFQGYSGKFDDDAVEQIRQHPDVESVEQDRVISIADIMEEQGAPYGLGYISHKSTTSEDYFFDSTAGQDSFAYVVDTGININHVEFEGRASLGFNAVPNVPNTDTVGHGTHVAGTIISRKYGVAKKAHAISVKVFDGDSGTNAALIDGINFIVKDVQTKNRTSKAVVNISTSGGFFKPLNDAIEAAIETGVVFSVAAGNDDHDASQNSPASAPNAITVGSVGTGLVRSSFSNFGTVVDIFAPGEDVLSCWIGSDTATMIIGGTSMATPHITGLIAYFQTLEHLATPADATAKLFSFATTGRVKGSLHGAPSRFPYNNSGQ